VFVVEWIALDRRRRLPAACFDPVSPGPVNAALLVQRCQCGPVSAQEQMRYCLRTQTENENAVNHGFPGFEGRESCTKRESYFRADFVSLIRQLRAIRGSIE